MPTLSHSSQTTQSPPLPLAEPIIDWIDRELHETYANAYGRGGNQLLELRQAFRQHSLNKMVGRFYRLLPQLDQHHFLLGYRIRHWLSLHFEIKISDPLNRVEPKNFPIAQNQRSLEHCKDSFLKQSSTDTPSGDIRVQVKMV